MEIDQAKQILKQVSCLASNFKDDYGYFFDSIKYDRENTDEKFEQSLILESIDYLAKVDYLISIINTPIAAQGRLFKNKTGRYEIKGASVNLTSGYPIEIWDEEEEVFIRTRIEHNGKDYYAVALGRNTSINGKLVRVRK